MFFHLSVRPNSRYSEFVGTYQVKKFLNSLEEIVLNQPMMYKNSSAFPWLSLMLVVASGEGNYALKNVEEPQINLIALIASSEENREKYLVLLRKIADFLGWQIHDEDSDRVIE